MTTSIALLEERIRRSPLGSLVTPDGSVTKADP
jgi:hypothetical protein